MGLHALATGMPENEGYLVRTVVTVDGATYSDELADLVGTGEDKTYYWNLYDLFTYPGSPTAGRGTWPLPEGAEVVATFTLLKSFGQVLGSWTTVLDACDGGGITYNGPAITDADGVPSGLDACPNLGVATADGCPTRTLSLTFRGRADRLVGRLTSDGGGATAYAHARVQVWQVGRGEPHLKMAAVRTTGTGAFFLPRGRWTPGATYLATSRGVDLGSGDFLTKVRSPTIQLG